MIEIIQLFAGLLCFFGAVLVFGLAALWFGCRADNQRTDDDESNY